jgi:Zn-dependent M28 family amino/carboxypeptidase
LKTASTALVLLAGALLNLAPVQGGQDTGGPLGLRLEAHVRFLASDLLRGREPGTDGYDIAAAYVASQFRQLGLQPAGDNDGYFQQVPLRRSYLQDDSVSLAAQVADARQSFAFVKEFFTSPSLAHENSEVTAPTVFAGYGIHAPELDYSDYGNIDASGRIAVIFSGKPEALSSEEGAHFASAREKSRAAMEHGAVGLLQVHTHRRERRFAWQRLKSRVGKPAMGWLANGGEPFAGFGQLRVRAALHYDAAAILFRGQEHTIDALLQLDGAGEALPAFALDAVVTARQASRHDYLTSPNVIGLLPGSDPMLRDEILVYVAHLDHIGELSGNHEGDSINNGALDNASGVAVLIETARAFVAGPRPRRSVLFLAVTAEEKGLVGSEYFARNPTIPVESIVGAINLDMPLLLYEFGDVIAFGAEHSTLLEPVRQAAAEFGIGVAPDPMPEENIFVRSDHYRFVQRGVPSIFLVTGPTALDGSTDTQPIFKEFLAEHYHQPSDDIDLPINYLAAARFTLINRRIGEIVANDTQRPAWREGDFFGTTFRR